MLSLPKDANEIMVLRTFFAFILHGKSEISSLKSPNQNTVKYLNYVTRYIRIAKRGKTSKMVQLHGC